MSVSKKSQEEALFKETQLRSMLGDELYESGGLCGKDWLLEHGLDVTNDDIGNESLEVISGNRKVEILSRMRRGDVKVVLASVITEGSLAQHLSAESKTMNAPSRGQKKGK